MGIEFYNTRMGHQYYESTMPRVAKSLEQIAKMTPTLERIADALEKIAKNQEEPDTPVNIPCESESTDDLTPISEGKDQDDDLVGEQIKKELDAINFISGMDDEDDDLKKIAKAADQSLKEKEETDSLGEPSTLEDMLDMVMKVAEKENKASASSYPEEPVRERDRDDGPSFMQMCPYYKKGRCSGTREFETCNCDGHRIRCTHYKEERNKAMAEYEKIVSDLQAKLSVGDISLGQMLELLSKFNF